MGAHVQEGQRPVPTTESQGNQNASFPLTKDYISTYKRKLLSACCCYQHCLEIGNIFDIQVYGGRKDPGMRNPQKLGCLPFPTVKRTHLPHLIPNVANCWKNPVSFPFPKMMFVVLSRRSPARTDACSTEALPCLLVQRFSPSLSPGLARSFGLGT